MTPYTALLNEVLPEVLGCPNITAERAIRDSAIEFFDATLGYKVDQGPISVTLGVETINLSVPADTRLVQVLRAQMGRRPLSRITREQLMTSGTSWQTDTGTPTAVVYGTETSIRLLPIPDQTPTEQLFLQFAVTPSRTSTQIPTPLVERYFREICTGAKSSLMLMMQKDWSNEKMGVAYRNMYERMISEACLTESQDRIAAQARVRLRRVA